MKKEPEIFLSEFYSDDGEKIVRIFYKAFGGGNSFIAKCYEKNFKVTTLYAHTEDDIEMNAEDWVLAR
tara:strand:- start:1109 stop:1312 length:204 start_codon:yes stop_codon:yes gene_type:complete